MTESRVASYLMIYPGRESEVVGGCVLDRCGLCRCQEVVFYIAYDMDKALSASMEEGSRPCLLNQESL